MIVRTLVLLLVSTTIGAAAAAATGNAQTLTEIEQLRRENAYLQAKLARTLDERDDCRTELAPLRKIRDDGIVQRAIAKLKADLEAAHPGFVFRPETGALEPVPVPQPPAAPIMKP